MKEYKNKQELMDEISKKAKLFIDEFSDVREDEKDKLVDSVERTPVQMIAYQLGWLNLLLQWERLEQQGLTVVTPHPDYKWNRLGGLYEDFYNQYKNHSLQELRESFQEAVEQILLLTESFTEDELFQPGGRTWSSSTPSNWPIWKWIHINTVAPFQSFRGKIRKWKKLKTFKIPVEK